jgi:hypothetical protein
MNASHERHRDFAPKIIWVLCNVPVYLDSVVLESLCLKRLVWSLEVPLQLHEKVSFLGVISSALSWGE